MALVVGMVLSLWNIVTAEVAWDQIENLAVFPIARSAFLPDITFDQERRAMIIGRGNAAPQIPYADIARVEVAPVQDRIGGLAVYVVQHNGEQIKLGAITKASMDESADGIVRLIARETGAQMQPPVAEEA